MQMQVKVPSGVEIVHEIDRCLTAEDIDALGSFVKSVGFDHVYSDETLWTARAMRRTAVVVFLSSFAVEYGYNLPRAVFWRDVYLGFLNRDAKCGILSERENSAFSDLVFKLIENDKSQRLMFKLSEDQLRDAYEICFDLGGVEAAERFLRSIPNSRLTHAVFAKIVKSAVARQVHLVSDADFACLRSLYGVFVLKLKFRNHKSLINMVHLMLGDACVKTQYYAQALQSFKLAYAAQPIPRTLAILAQTLCRNDLHLESINAMDHLISELLYLGLDGSKVVGASDIFFPVPGEGTYTSDLAKTALAALMSFARECGERLFLVSGTLLGFARAGGVLSHDKDVDLGIVGVDRLVVLLRYLVKQSDFQVLPNYLKGEDTIHQPVIHGPTGVWIDIFVYHPRADKWVTGVDIQFGYRQTFAFTPFDLVEADFMNTRVHVPRDFELNLTENFGDWKTPDKDYLSHIESPSLIEKGTLVHQLAMRLWVVRSLQYGFGGKLRKLVAKLDETQGGEGAMQLALLDRLRVCVPGAN